MIKINLLPLDLRPQKSKKSSAGLDGFSGALQFSKPVLAALAGAGVVFIGLTAFFYTSYLGLNGKLSRVNQAYLDIQPRVQVVRALEQEVTNLLQPEKNFLKANILNKAPLTSILQVMNDALPDGVWLTALSINNSGEKRSFQLQGVALNTQEKTSIQQIEHYLHQIKMVIPNSQFAYSTGKQQGSESAAATAFTANFHWQAD